MQIVSLEDNAHKMSQYLCTYISGRGRMSVEIIFGKAIPN